MWYILFKISKGRADCMKKLPLGIPLAVGMAGTVASLFIGNKKVHTAFGIVWTAVSLLHAYQYKKNMKNNLKRGFQKMNIFKVMGLPTSKMEWFLQSVEVGSYLPGRIRVYSKALINNQGLKEKVASSLDTYKELEKYTINTISGSVLIEYDPMKIKSNKELCDIEAYIKKRAQKK